MKQRAEKTRKTATRGAAGTTAPPARSAALASEIAEWLRRRDLNPGDHVPEAPLTSAFKVSRTPIRAALAILAEAGILARRANRGYFLTRNLDSTQITLRPEEERLREKVLKDRLDRRLETGLTAARLMRRYGIQRAQAQRLLERLARDGLVSLAHGARWHFHPSLDSPRSLDHAYRFRLIVEPASLLEPDFNLDNADVARMRRLLSAQCAPSKETELADPSWVASMIDLDIAFHDLLASASGNRFLEEAIRQQGRLRRLALSASRVPAKRLRDSMAEHLAILDAAAAGRLKLAAGLMRQHLLASKLGRPYLANRGAPSMAVGPAAGIARQGT